MSATMKTRWLLPLCGILLVAVVQADEPATETTAGWIKHPKNAVLGGTLGTCFDVSVLKDGGQYRMWFSWRPKKSIALVESPDGVQWNKPVIVLGPNAQTDWEQDVNRPVVIKHGERYQMWYTGQARSKGLSRKTPGFPQHDEHALIRTWFSLWWFESTPGSLMTGDASRCNPLTFQRVVSFPGRPFPLPFVAGGCHRMPLVARGVCNRRARTRSRTRCRPQRASSTWPCGCSGRRRRSSTAPGSRRRWNGSSRRGHAGSSCPGPRPAHEGDAAMRMQTTLSGSALCSSLTSHPAEPG